MCYNLNPLVLFNMTLCIVIFIIGCGGYAGTKKKAVFHIGAAFGLFAMSHLITLMRIQGSYYYAIVLINAFGYSIIALSLYHMASEK